MGALLKNYFAVGHDSLDNYIAQISGQAPDPATQNDCGKWTRFEPANTAARRSTSSSATAASTRRRSRRWATSFSQAKLSWKAYLQDMGNEPSRDHTTMTKQGPACGHPAIGTNDDTEGAVPADQYAARHEGFMYFGSVIANRSFCDRTSSRSSRCCTTWLGPTPRRRSRGSRRTCASTGTTRRAYRRPRRPGRDRRVPAHLGAEDPELARLQGRRPDRRSPSTRAATAPPAAARHPASRAVAPQHAAARQDRARAAAASARSCCPRSSSPAPSAPWTTTTTPRCAAWRTCSACSHLGDAAMPQVKSFGPDVYTNP